MGKKIFKQFLFLRGANYFATSLTYGMLTLFFTTAKGCSIEVAGYLFGAYLFTLGVCEIPTGIFADSIGRKRSFLLSCIVQGAGFIMLCVSTSFTMMLVSQIVRALGTTLGNGAIDSWAYDEIDRLDPTNIKLRQAIYKYNFGLRYVVGIIGGSIGAWLSGRYNFYVPLVGSAILLVLVLGLSWFLMIEVRHRHCLSLFEEVTDIIRQTTQAVRKDRVLQFMMAMSALTALPLGNGDNQWQELFRLLVGDTSKHAIIWPIISGSVLLGTVIMLRFLKPFIEYFRAVFVVSAMVTAISFCGTVLSTTWVVALFWYGFHDVVRGIIDPVKFSIASSRVDSRIRATVVSSVSAAGTICHGFGSTIGSSLTSHVGMKNSWLVLSVVLCLGTCCIYIFFRTRKTQE